MRAALLLLACVVLAGCGAPATSPSTSSDPPGGDAPVEPERYNTTITLPPRGSREVNFHMDAGAQVRIVLDASVPMDWDLHSHNGNAVDTWEEGADERAVDVTFSAPDANTYSVWLRSASSGTTIVRVDLTGAFEIEA